MEISRLSFGSVVIDGHEFHQDVIIDRGKVALRDSTPSRIYREEFGHTPLSLSEAIPWDCKTLIIGNGMSSAMPVTEEVLQKAREKGVQIVLLSTPEAAKRLNDPQTNLILHLTC